MAKCSSIFTLVLSAVVLLMISSHPAAADGEENDSMANNTAPFLLVFLQQKNSSEWLLVRVNANTGKSHVVVRTQRSESPAQCGFALQDSSAVFYNGMALETWSLTTGKKTSTVKMDNYALQTIAYNPSDRLVEGVCQMWLPEQNMSATCLCAVHGSNMSSVLQMPTDFIGEARSDCTNSIDPETSTFWYAAASYDNMNRFFAGLATSASSTMYDWKWFGVINGTLTSDGYVFDNNLNRSFGIQLNPEDKTNTTSQLIEVLAGQNPTMKNNPSPKVLHVFPDHFGLSQAGLMVYDDTKRMIYAIMEIHEEGIVPGTTGKVQYLAKISVDSLKTTYQEIEWPDTPAGLSPNSMKLWKGATEQ